MDWKNEAKKELRNYDYLKSSLGNISERIKGLEAQKTGIKSFDASSVPVQGGGNKHEDMLINCIVEQDRLKLTYRANRIRVKLVERGLNALTEQDRLVLKTFASNKPGVAVDILAEQIGYERAQIYRLYDAALYRFTIAEYGIPEF